MVQQQKSSVEVGIATVTNLKRGEELSIPLLSKLANFGTVFLLTRETLGDAEENKLAIWIDFSSFSSREAFFKYLVRYSFDNLSIFYY